MRLAVLADIHGNLAALEAILADMAHQGVDGIIVAGDFVDQPQPLETVGMLRALGCWMIRGNRENYLLAYHRGDAPERWHVSIQWTGLRWSYRQLDREALGFMASLPEQRVVAVDGTAPIRVVHGSPRSVTELLLPDHDPVAMAQYEQAGLLALNYSQLGLDAALAEFDEPVLVCGHSHIPWSQHQKGRFVVNPGSAGAPLDGNVRAQYAVLTWQRGEWRAEHRAIPYDLDRIRDAYRESGALAQGGGFTRALLRCIETGQNVPGHLLDHFYALAARAGFGDQDVIPDSIWEQAVATFDWKTGRVSHEGRNSIGHSRQHLETGNASGST
jgi:predicted phosphodiesterase